MKTLLLTGAVCSILTTAASAADFAAEPSYDWAGFYTGAHIGGAWGQAGHDLSDTVTTIVGDDDVGTDGAIGGLHAGYNFQSGTWVYGVEINLDKSSVEGDENYQGVPVITPPDYHNGSLTFEQEWMASVRGRVGKTIDNILVYATGGVAVMEADFDYAGLVSLGIHMPFEYGSNAQTHVGFVIGAGAEFRFAESWSARLEAVYTGFGEETYDFDTGPVEVDLGVVSVTGGVSYHF